MTRRRRSASSTSATTVSNPAGRYRLIRIGDAVASRNIHAAIFDGRRAALSVGG